MSRCRVYLRVAPTSRGFRVAATTKPTHTPIYDSKNRVLPTIAFAIDLNIDARAFDVARAVVAEIDIPAEIPTVAAEAVR